MTTRRVAVITGAGSGIGAATVLEFVKHGEYVLACDVNPIPASQFAKCGDFVETMVVNAASEADTRRAIEHAVKKWGTLTCVFANAGISGPPSFFADVEEDEINQLMRVNVNGVFFAWKHGAIAMQKLRVNNATLLATASVAGIRSGAGSAAYSASKAAVISLTQTFCNQLNGTGIRVNCICPGLIETGMVKFVFDQADAKGTRAKIGQINPMKRYGEAREIATVAYFLSSEGASYVNGQALAVDGGLSSSHPVAVAKPGRVSL
jgi:NAD(P)-dependent dehydrogenase (short-subunit alcohol dehydrogenase family)